jgi:sugar phosphate isomerase/epimerase
MVKLAVQTNRLPGKSLTEQFAIAGNCGYDAVEINVGPEFDLADRFGDVQNASRDTGIPVSGICTHSMHDPLVPDADERAARFAGLAELLQLADDLGAAGVVSVPVRPPHEFTDFANPETDLMDFAESEFRQWAETLPTGNSAVFLEPLNRYEAYFLRRVEQGVELARRVSSPRILALADLFHMNIEEADMAEPIIAAGTLLGYVHIADNNRLQPGAGCLDFGTPFRALKRNGYDGYISIECSALGGPLAADGPEAMLRASAAFLREQWASA